MRLRVQAPLSGRGMATSERWRTDVESALQTISSAIEEVVRAEQQRNDLTGLPNELALSARLDDELENNTVFWCAFIEIDHFKRVNTIYKYEAANAMLRAVASTIANSAEHTFDPPAEAYHAHGDEFYVIGKSRSGDANDQTQGGLDRLRDQVAAIKKGVSGHDTPMQATVTIGWLSTLDMVGEDVSRPHIRKCIESAVGHGKRAGRNVTVRYDKNVADVSVYSERENCINPSCQASFTVEADESDLTKGEHLWCPNCGTKLPRPVQSHTQPAAIADI